MKPRVAIAHDYLVDSGGAERVVIALHENAALGYRVHLPESYRRWFGRADALGGVDVFTRRTGDLCVRSLDLESDIKVEVLPNAEGVSPVAFASTGPRVLRFTSVESTTVSGHPAARVVHDQSGDTAFYVIAVNDRLYVIGTEVISQPSRQPQGWLDRIVTTFVAIPPRPPASPPPYTPPCGPASLPSTSTASVR